LNIPDSVAIAIWEEQQQNKMPEAMSPRAVRVPSKKPANNFPKK
jgi:hypothetical protein